MYFQLHQPHRLRKYSIFEIGKSRNYFNDPKNEKIVKKVAGKCYIPANQTILDLIHSTDGKFKASFSMSGTILEQLEAHVPEVIESFKNLIKTGCVEILDETYHHSLSSVFNQDEFKEQVGMHRKKIKNMFGFIPQVFRNTELIYSNEIAKLAEDMGYQAVLAEGADKILDWRSSNFVYTPVGTKIKLLLKNHKLSDDIAFRFGDMGWEEYPLTAEKFAQWISAVNGNGEIINLFMDYETFGEHQWEEKGIFNFLKALPSEILKHPDNNFVTPMDAIKKFEPVAELDVPYHTSWADIERDLSAWLGNNMQTQAAEKLYELTPLVTRSNNPELIRDWRNLQTSDHFYYMCTKWFNDGDVHKYFNPFDSPYEAFISFMNILNDVRLRLREANIMATEKKWLNDVPQENMFWIKDGTGIRNMAELSASFRTMANETYKHHATAERNDFANWVKLVVGDEVLATNLQNCKRKIMAAKLVEERIKYLRQ